MADDDLARLLAETCREFKSGRNGDDGGRQAVGKALSVILIYLEAVRPDIVSHIMPIHHLLSVLADLDEGREIDPMLRRPPIKRGRPQEPQRHSLFKQMVAAATFILASEGKTRDQASHEVWRRLRGLGWKGGKIGAPKGFLDEMEKFGRQDARTELYHAHLEKWAARGSDPTMSGISAEQWMKSILSKNVKEFF